MQVQMAFIEACQRCGRLCKPGTPGDPEARLLQRAPTGLCGNCAVTQFLLSIEPIRQTLTAHGTAMLLDDQVRLKFAQILAAGHADLPPGEIDWQVVVNQWNLPFPRRSKRGA